MSIQHTTDYDKFYLPIGNRAVDMSHAERIAKEIKGGNDLLADYPILVVEDPEVGCYSIIDGQHRLLAARLANVPVYFMVSSGADTLSIARANMNTKRWALEDYMNHYRYQSTDYSQLYRLWQQHDFFTLSTFLGVLPSMGHRPTRTFREGSYQYSTEHRDHIETLSGVLRNLSDHYDFWSHRSFVLAVNQIVRHNGYDHDRMLAKHQYSRVSQQPNKTHYLRAFEELYNYRAQIRVYFTR